MRGKHFFGQLWLLLGSHDYDQPLPDNLAQPSTTNRRIILALLAVMCLFAALRFNDYRDATSPILGFSPVGMVYHYFEKDNFARDYPSGTENYYRSSFTHLYLIAYERFGITPETMVPLVITFEVVLIALSLLILTRVVLPNAPPVLILFVVLLYLCSFTQFLDIGKVGHYIHGKVNNVGDMLRILSLAALLAGRLPLAGLLLGLCFTVNPIYACLTAALFGPILLVRPRPASWGSIIIGGLVFLGISLGWLLNNYQMASFTLGTIPNETWFELSRLCSGHWFPIDLGVLTTRHNLHFLPLLSMCLLILHGMSHLKDIQTRRMFYGFIAMVPLIALGIIAARFELSQTLVKAQLFRADQIYITAGLIFAAQGLLIEIRRGNPLRAGLAAAALFSPFFIKPGYPVFYSLLLALPPLVGIPWSRQRATQRATAILGVSILLLIAFYVVSGYFTWKFYPVYFGSIESTLIGALTVAALWMLGSKPLERWIPAALVLLCLASGIIWTQSFGPSAETRAYNQDYKDAQLWAYANTTPDSLFMIDPTIYFGWRDYSHRSSFGSVREWLYNWTNSNDYATYAEGLKRFGEYGLDYKDYLNAKPKSIAGFFRIRNVLRDRFNNPQQEWLDALTKKYGIDYVVYAKQYLKSPPDLPLAYENEGFAIYETRVRKPSGS